MAFLWSLALGIAFLLIWALKTVLWFAGLFFFALWYLQGSLLYLQNMGDREGEKRKLSFNEQGYQSPVDFDMLHFEDVWMDTRRGGNKIHAWLIKQAQNHQQVPTLIFLHGNAGNIGFRLPNFANLYRFTGCNILAVEYRGYGNSDGTPSELGLMEDGQLALDYLLQRGDIHPQKICVFGRSLGGAVAVSLAANNPHAIAGVVLENTFSSLDELVQVLLARIIPIKPVFGHLLRRFLYLFLTSHWESEKKIAQLRMPILFIAGLKDELIPSEQMQRLYAATTTHNPSVRSSSANVWYGVENGTHNDTFLKGGQEYYQKFYQFILSIHEKNDTTNSFRSSNSGYASKADTSYQTTQQQEFSM